MSPRAVLRRVVLILGSAVLLGLVAGAVWEWLWTPPTGMVWQGHWVLDNVGVTQDYSATGLYAVVAAVAGGVLGIGCAARCRGQELLTLATALLASFLAGWVMLWTGAALGPPDPQTLVASHRDYDPLPDNLWLTGVTPSLWPITIGSSAQLAFPLGTTLVLGAAYTMLAPRRSRSRAHGGEDEERAHSFDEPRAG